MNYLQRHKKMPTVPTNTDEIKNVFLERRKREKEIVSRMVVACAKEYTQLAQIKQQSENVHLQEKLQMMTSLAQCINRQSLCMKQQHSINKCASLVNTTRHNFEQLDLHGLQKCTNDVKQCFTFINDVQERDL